LARNLKEVFQEAAQLPERDRATLAGLLIETLDPVSEPDVEAAWSEEIKRRLAEIDAGTVELIPWEEVRAEFERCDLCRNKSRVPHYQADCANGKQQLSLVPCDVGKRVA